ncbi:hypothetical protein [Halobacillus karajensis]|uniref:Uncharacterized protein n=1 Tax=Halobacillus karajensis TaxID=195088 RepID=A0A024P896_9BACI|nr:hypothetical protein [Halobacillus karajensis]CDQ20985.1 hypothetical protein BN982_03346 [Halobacillus karajensis]CDQ24951.1 hypothetical protein BN983_03252 [Halobacillus karajensis]CDQ28688.1 hypothetical protein BN981_03001 [Halobacillus karajensis]
MTEQNWNELKQYVDNTMAKNRRSGGKFNKENFTLWKLKRKMQELDPSIESVGETFDKHENGNYDTEGVQ